MDRVYSNLFIHLVLWICLSIFLPLLPIGLGILIATLQQVEVTLFDLLDGIELLLISLGLVTATGIDLSKARSEWSRRALQFFLIRLLLILLGIGNIILLTLIYVNDRVTDLRFDTGTKFTFVVILAVAISLITVVLQLHIGYIRHKRSMEEATS